MSTTPFRRADIGVWGPPKVGKTALLTAAVRTLRNGMLDDRYDVLEPLDLPDDHERRQGARTMLDNVRTMGKGGIVDKTIFDLENTPPFTLYIGYRDHPNDQKRGQGLDGHFYEFTLLDAAGEYVNERNPTHPYWQHLHHARAIMLFLDGTLPTYEFEGQTYESMLELFVSNMQKAPMVRNRLPHYLAICITKGDQVAPEGPDVALAYDDAPNSSGESPVRQLLSNLIGPSVYPLLTGRFFQDRIRVFLTSAYGWARETSVGRQTWKANASETSGTTSGTIEPPQFSLEKRGNEWKPYNAVSPWLWLFDRIDEQRLYDAFPTRTLGPIDALWPLREYVRHRRRTNLAIRNQALSNEPDALRTYYP